MPFSALTGPALIKLALIKLVRGACHQAVGGFGVVGADFYAVAA